MIKFLYAIIDLLIPRFITEDVALEEIDGVLEIVCSMAAISEGEVFDGVVSIRSFTWLGLCVFPKQVGEVREWVR